MCRVCAQGSFECMNTKVLGPVLCFGPLRFEKHPIGGHWNWFRKMALHCLKHRASRWCLLRSSASAETGEQSCWCSCSSQLCLCIEPWSSERLPCPSTLRSGHAPIFGERNEPDRLEREALVEAANSVLAKLVVIRRGPNSSAGGVKTNVGPRLQKVNHIDADRSTSAARSRTEEKAPTALMGRAPKY